MNSRATQLKFWCPRKSHYASHYHYGSQSIAWSGQWECWTGWSQPVNCINLHKHRTPHCTAEWAYCLFAILLHGSGRTVLEQLLIYYTCVQPCIAIFHYLSRIIHRRIFYSLFISKCSFQSFYSINFAQSLPYIYIYGGSLPPEDSFWMKQTVVVTFWRTLLTLIITYTFCSVYVTLSTLL